MHTTLLIGLLPILLIALVVERVVVRRRRAQAAAIITAGLDAHLTAQSMALTCARDAAVVVRDGMREQWTLLEPLAMTLHAQPWPGIDLDALNRDIAQVQRNTVVRATDMHERIMTLGAGEKTTPDTAGGIGGSGGGEHRHSQGSNPGVENGRKITSFVGAHNPPVQVRGKRTGGALVVLDCTRCGTDLLPNLTEALVNGCPTCRRRRAIAVVPSVATPAAALVRSA